MSLRRQSGRIDRSLSYRITRFLIIFLFLYFSVIGATFNGVLIWMTWQQVTLALFAVIAGSWLVIRHRRGWQWRRLPLDPVFVLWVIAFVVSLLANPESWRRSAEGLWFMGLYIGVFYILLDAIGHGLRRAILAESIMLVGFTTVLFGYLQLFNAIQEFGLAEWVQLFLNQGARFRPVSNIGNPNALGVFLVMLTPFIVAQMAYTRIRFVRIVMGLYAVFTLGLLFLSFSRGAWLGVGAALGVLFLMWLADRDMLSIKALRAWWQGQSGRIKALTGGATLLVVGVGLAVIFLLIQSFSDAGRSTDLRTRLWEAAFTQFAEQPITGQGIFTYGRRLGTFWSIPPQQPHAHAHNLPLHILSETGLIGGTAMILSLIAIFVLWRRNWRSVKTGRTVFIGGTAAAVGFGVHHLFDVPAMMPLIALMGITVLTIMIAQDDAPVMSSRWMQRGHTAGMIVLWVLLLIAGFWQNGIHSQYRDILVTVAETEDYEAAAFAMQPVVDADPSQPAYVLQLAYLHGLAALENDNPQPGIAAYERYLVLEPYHSSAWANLAGLHWQAGDAEAALTAIEEAIALAPAWAHYKWQRDIYDGTVRVVSDIDVPESINLWGINWARFQYLRDIMVPEYLPQAGWGTR